MERFGDFHLIEKIIEKGPVVQFKASHPRQEKTLLLTIYQGFAPKEQLALRLKFDHLLGLSHPHLEPHLGHGIVGEVPYRVTAFVDGISLAQFLDSIKKRRVNLPMDNLFSIARALAKGLHALHSHQKKDPDFQLTHGDIQARNVHIAPNGRVLLAGAGSWNNVGSSDPMEKVWDGAGLAALIYQMLRATKIGDDAPSLTPDFDDLLRVALGIGNIDEMMTAKAFGTRLREIAIRQHVYTTLDRFRDLAHRTCRLVTAEQERDKELQLKIQEEIEQNLEERASAKEEHEEVFSVDLETMNDETSSVEISTMALNNGQQTFPGSTAQQDLQSHQDTTANEAQITSAAQQTGAAVNTAKENVAPLAAENAPTKKERLTFFQWVKNKQVFPDALLQMLMDSYDEASDILNALWDSSAVPHHELVNQLGTWLSVPSHDAKGIVSCVPEAGLLASIPPGICLSECLLPLNKKGSTLRCLTSNPFQKEATDILKSNFDVTEIEFEVTSPRLVIEHSMRMLQQEGCGGLLSPLGLMEITVLIFDPQRLFPMELAQKLGRKGWLVEWSSDPKVVLQMALMNSPAAVFCMTQIGETDAIELLVELKTQPIVGQTAYFVLGNDDDEEIEKILDLGVDDYFSPPINIENVVAKLKRAFNRNLNYDSKPPMDAVHMPGPPPIPSTGFMEDMILAAGLGEDHEHVEPDGTLGRIGDINVFDVVQHLIVRKKSIRLSLEGETQGHLDIKDGHICGAHQGANNGAAAFINLIKVTQGMFSIETLPSKYTENLTQSTSTLLVEAHHALITN